MSAALGLGTYRCRDVIAAGRAAIAAGVTWFDTAPVYARGTAQLQLGHLLAEQPRVQVSTKVGHMTREQTRAARRAGVVTTEEAARQHSISPRYIRYQLIANATELGQAPIDLLYLHNPEHGVHNDRRRLLKQITQGFEACEQAVHDGHILGYGIATWSGFASRAFTVQDLAFAAYDAAGGHRTHFQGIQLPVSMVQLSPVVQALNGTGPIHHAVEAGLDVWASAPLNGGELADMVTDELAGLVAPGILPVQAALAVVASTPGLSGALLSASTTAHWLQACDAFTRAPLPPAHLRKVCRVLRA